MYYHNFYCSMRILFAKIRRRVYLLKNIQIKSRVYSLESSNGINNLAHNLDSGIRNKTLISLLLQ